MDNKVKCDFFNRYFLEIPKTLKQQIEYLPGDSCNGLKTLSISQQSFDLFYTTDLEVSEAISKLDLTKSCDYDGIPPKMLLECKDDISPYLSKFFNNMIDSTVYPDNLKIAKIIPIPKQRYATEVDKFRPIAILPLIDKIFEKILCKQLIRYLDEHNLLYRWQFGFKKGCSTKEAVVNVVNNICHGLDNGFRGVACVFYDFSKVFDHKILINKLGYNGLSTRAVMLLENYLTFRRQYLEINNCKSFIDAVKDGVLQSSVLCPLLFAICINDLMNLGLFGKLVLYTDDICLLYPYKHEIALRVQWNEIQR